MAVEADWARGEKLKETRLEYEDAAVFLDHAAGTVSHDEEIGSTALSRARPALPRLTHQYLAVFRDL